MSTPRKALVLNITNGTDTADLIILRSGSEKPEDTKAYAMRVNSFVFGPAPCLKHLFSGTMLEAAQKALEVHPPGEWRKAVFRDFDDGRGLVEVQPNQTTH